MIAGAVLLYVLSVAAQPEPEYMQPAPGTKPRTAVFELTVHNKMPDDDINVVIDRLYKELRGTNRFDLMDRAQTQRVLEDLGTHYLACATPECASEAGRMIGIEKAIVGDVSKVELTYFITLEQVDVATGTVDKKVEEEVAGNMDDVANVGVMLVVRKLVSEEKEPEYKKGDWKKIRAQGLGGRISVVMPIPLEHEQEQHVTKTDEPRLGDTTIVRDFNDVGARPTLGIGIQWDAMFRLRNGAEFHYTPSIEGWVRQDFGLDHVKRYGEVAFNALDIRYLFSPPSDRRLTFFVGLGGALLLNTYRDESPIYGEPLEDPLFAKLRVGGNVLAGLERSLKRSGMNMSIELRLKILHPVVVKITMALTKPLGKKTAEGEGEEDDLEDEDDDVDEETEAGDEQEAPAVDEEAPVPAPLE
jgi:hypothetical protein